MLNTTIGKLVVEDALPEDMKDWAQLSFNKKTLGAFMADLAQRHPDEYRDVTHKLLQIARQGALESGSNSFGLKHIKVSPAAKARRAKLLKEVHAINDDDSLSDTQRNNKLIKTIAKAKEGFESELMEEAKAENSPLERMISSGARGNPGSLASLRGGDFQYVDSEGNALPVPIAKSYGEGLDPVSYWAGSFGARQGLLSAKFSTAESGYFAKRLQQAAHRLLVTGVDEDHERDGEIRGMPANSDDPHNEGSLLAHPAGGYAKNTILTPKILQDLKRKGIGRILVRSPIVGGARDGGLLARDVGIRESGDLPHPGSLVGLLAAQSIAERLSQQALGAKHLGGIAGKGVEQLTQGFPLVEQLVDIPKAFKGGATHAQTDGVVQLIHEAPAGGMYVTVNDQDHYIPVGHTVSVKRGDHIEAGDMLSSGIPNPSEIVKHKGIGEGRRYFTHQLAGVLQQAGVNAHRRNVELVARAMIDHVKMNDEFSDWLPGDVVSYQTLERNWHPREGFKQLEPKAAVGQYLEKPVLHYTVGTKIQPSMIKDMDEFGIKNLAVHENPPPFEPLMVRSEDSLQHDPDWVSQMYGSGLKKNLLKSVHRGATSDEKGTSFVPSLAKGVNFGLVEPFNKLNKKMGEEKQANSDIYGGDLMTEDAPVESGSNDLTPEAENASRNISNYIHYVTHPGEQDADLRTPRDVIMAPVEHPKEYWSYLTNPNERDKDLGFKDNAKRMASTIAQYKIYPVSTKGMLGAAVANEVLPDNVNPLNVVNNKIEGITGGKAYDIQDWGLVQDKDEQGNRIVTTPSEIRDDNYAMTPNTKGVPRAIAEAQSRAAQELGVELTGDPVRDRIRLEVAQHDRQLERQKTIDSYAGRSDESLRNQQVVNPDPIRAEVIAKRQKIQQQDYERAQQTIVPQQEADIAAVRAQNPADPYLQGQQYAAQFAMDHFPDSRATEHQKNVDFIAQHPAPKLNSEEQMALQKARSSVTPEMMAKYGPGPSSVGPASSQVGYATQKPGPSAKSLGATAAMSQPSKIPTPPKMNSTSPTGPLPLVPGGKG